MKKNVFTRAAIAGLLIFLALSLGTCGAALSDGDGGGSTGSVEWVDYEFYQLPDGTERFTLYLLPEGMDENTKPGPDTFGVPLSKSARMLDQRVARRSYDFAEAVFVAGTAQTIARASWSIGQPAGIRGVRRSVDYGTVNSATVNDSTGNAIICLGRSYSSGGTATLLAIGSVTSATNGTTTSGTTINADSISVTFTVSGLATEVGYDFKSTTTPTPFNETFLTNTVPPYTNTLTSITVASTRVGVATFKNKATYTLFGLPGPGTSAPFSVPAIYTIGLTEPTISDSAGIKFDGLKVWDDDVFDSDIHLALYRTAGQKFDVNEADLDTWTEMELGGTTGTGIYSDVGGADFAPIFPLNFKIVENSYGVFGFTFWTYVCAITKLESTNGGPDASKWMVSPAHGEDRYILDDRKSPAGMVLMGVNVSGLDWLEILWEWVEP